MKRKKIIMGISLKELKKNRLTPAEKWVLETIEGCVPETKQNGNVNWFSKDGERLFEQNFKNGWLELSFLYIWTVLGDDFGLNNNDIEDLLTNILYDYTDNGKLTPQCLWIQNPISRFVMGS